MSQYNPLWTVAGRIFTSFCLVALLASSASAADLIGYYEFEGNYNDSSSSGNNAAAVIPGGAINFGASFRGAGIDMVAGGGGGGPKVDIPINVNAITNGGSHNTVSFGGWVNADDTGGRGFAAADNGGWDRGLHQNQGSNWGIASGGANSGSGSVTVGNWQYVVGTFDKNANQAVLYVGDDNAATQTTNVTSRADSSNSGGLPTLEIGRYDNQDFDGQVDDFFVFNSTLNAEQANAVRNLRLSSLDYSPIQAEQLFDLFDAGSGEEEIGDLTWSNDSGLSGNPGELFDNGNGSYSLLLDVTNGTGVTGSAAAVVPEPASVAIWSLLGLCLAGYGYRRQRRQS